MKIIKKPLTNGQYRTALYKKTMLFIHHSISTTIDSIWGWWNQTPERIGTAYAIDRDGTIYEFFDPKFTAAHLGIKGNNSKLDNISIGIELVNIGPVYKGEDGKWYPEVFKTNKFKGKPIPEDEIVQMPWRGYKAFQKYTTEQLRALEELIPDILKRFPDIKLQPNHEAWWEFDQSVINNETPGIYSHTTVRKDKSDIVPYTQLTQTVKGIFAILSKAKKKALPIAARDE